MKIFINNSPGTAAESVRDLKRFCEESGNFNAPEVYLSDFKQNFDGLNPADNPTLVGPGGSANVLSSAYGDLHPKIKLLHTTRGFNVIAVCAWAYLVAHEAHMFKNDIFDSVYEPEILVKNLDLCTEFNALGSFTPNNSFKAFYTLPKYPPYATSVTFTESQKTLRQLFVLGCGFEKNPTAVSADCEVVATYADKNQYSFFYPQAQQPRREKKIEQLPAIITRNPGNTVGGLFMTGMHVLEGSMKDSEMLEYFNPTKAQQKTFSAEAYQSLVDSQAATREVIAPIIQRSMGIKK